MKTKIAFKLLRDICVMLAIFFFHIALSEPIENISTWMLYACSGWLLIDFAFWLDRKANKE